MDVTRGASLAGEHYATEGDLVRLTLGNFDYDNCGFKENTSKDNIYYTGDVNECFILKEGDVITPLTEQTPGLLGTTARVPESGKYIQSQDVALISCNPDLLDKDFAYYLLPSKIVKEQLAARAQQTKIRHTSPDKIKDCTVFIPSVEDQKKIAAILRSFDDKISINNKTCMSLEQTARDIYKFYFNNQQNSHLHGTFRNIKELCPVITGKEDANFSTENGQFPFFSCSMQSLWCDIPAFVGDAILIAGNGDFNVKFYSGRFNAYQRTYVLIPTDSKYFGVIYFSAMDCISSFKNRSNGSIIKFITKGDVESITIDTTVDDSIYNVINQLLHQICILRKESNQYLREKGTLMPMLMSGQIL